jgi:hypothetical protein
VLDNVATEPATTAVPKDKTTWAGDWDSYGFYELYNTTTDEDGVITAGSITAIPTASTTDFNAYGIYAGIVNYTNKVNERGGYIVVNGKQVKVTDVPVYTLTNEHDVNVATKADSLADVLAAGDKVIYVMNKAKTGVAYIVKVGTYKAPTTAATGLKDLYDAIVASQTTEIQATFSGTKPDGSNIASVTLTSGKDYTISKSDAAYAVDGYTLKLALDATTKDNCGGLYETDTAYVISNPTGNVKLNVTYEAEEYKAEYTIDSTNSEIDAVGTAPSFTAVRGDDTITDATKLHVGDVVTLTFKVTNSAVPSATSSQVSNLTPVVDANDADKYTITFTMPAKDVSIELAGAATYAVKLSATSTTVTYTASTVSVTGTLGNVGSSGVLRLGCKTVGKVLKVNSITMNGEVIPENYYTVDPSAKTITFKTAFKTTKVTGDIIIDAEEVDETVEITVNIATGAGDVAIATVSGGTLKEGTTNVYVVTKNANLVLTFTANTTVAANGLATDNGTLTAGANNTFELTYKATAAATIAITAAS